MPFRADLVDQGRALLFVGSGVVTAQEIIDCKHRLLERGDEIGGVTRATVLLNGLDAFEVTADQLLEIVEVDGLLARFAPRVRVAVVTDHDYVFAVGATWKVFMASTGWETAVFRALADAEAWLGIGMIRGTR